MMILKTVLHVENLLKQNEKFVDKDGNVFVQNILEAIEKIDKDLVKLLISDEKTREQFFIKIDDVFVLEQNKLIEFFTMNEYFNNSFTSYTNKIGLIKKDSFIKKFDDVVLAWPHKDCILEGGQSKDDDKKNEVFYNEILSRDEIDRLFEPKALTNIKRYTKEGVEENPQISEDDNFIIKGNNLIALYSLKKKYAGKVKLIYIDPPYNTGNDSFNYNDRFNHSTWLTFMKNRLEVARELLRSDGIVMITLDDMEFAYLKIVCDEIFGRANFICNFLWKKKSTSTNVEGVQVSPLCDYILTYAKSSTGRIKQRMRAKETRIYPHLDALGNFRTTIIEKKDAGNYKRETMKFEILGQKPREGKRWQIGQDLASELMNQDRFLIDDGIVKRKIYDFEDKDTYSANPSLLAGYGSSDSASKHVNVELFNVPELFSNPKPEELISYLIENASEENDIILDYHLGSATTAAVAHKMNRRYIGIEQMDYIEDIAVERMKKVIEGEQGGVSKAVEWSGGGSFVYAELKQIDTFAHAEIGKLNKNMQYLPVSEIEDAEYKISKDEIAINKKFYGLENE